MINIIKFEFKKGFKPLFIWTLGAVSFTIIYMMLYPIVRELTKSIFENMNGQIPEMIGAESLNMLSNYNRYFGSEFVTIICIFAGYACFTGASVFHGEYHSGSSEFLYTWYFSRNEIFFAKIISNILKSLIILTFSMFMVYLCGLIIAKNEVSLKVIVLAYLFFITVIIFSSSLGTLVSSIIKAKGNASLIALGIFLGLYLIGTLSGISEKYLGWLLWISPVMLLSPTKAVNIIMDGEKFVFFQLIIVIIYAIINYVIAFIFHKRKNI